MTRKSKFNSSPSSSFLIVPLLAVACAHSAAIAAPSTTRTVEVQTPCSGNCAPALVALAGGKVVALWASQNGRLWAQAIDSEDGALLGRNVELGYLSSPGGSFAQQPLAIALPDGDLALVGLLRDGRVTFSRGSDDAGRRVAPKVIVPATSSDVLSIRQLFEHQHGQLREAKLGCEEPADGAGPCDDHVVEHRASLPGRLRFACGARTGYAAYP